MTLNLKLRVALLALRLCLICVFFLALLLPGAGTTLQPWLMTGVVLFIGALGMTLLLSLVERGTANG